MFTLRPLSRKTPASRLGGDSAYCAAEHLWRRDYWESVCSSSRITLRKIGPCARAFLREGLALSGAGGIGQKVSLMCRARYSRSRCRPVRPAVLGLGMDLACLMQRVFALYIG